MKPIEEDLSGINTLPELFERWQKAQQDYGRGEQKNENKPKEFTFPDRHCASKKMPVNGYCEDFYTSFCYDGRLTDWQEGRKTILFICREANIADEEHIDKDKEMLLPETMREGNCPENFWMKEQYLCPEKRKNNKYCKLIQKVIGEPSESVNLAYMNLNKRGGFGACNMARVGHYVNLYKAYIAKEIELINPDLIICGGTYDTVVKYFPSLRDKCKNYYHPCYRIEEKTDKEGL